MYQKKDRSGAWKWVGLFFAGMVVFTLLSRAAYQHGTAVVTTAAPTGGPIAHTLRLTGKTEQNRERAVTTVAGLRVSDIRVNEGQRVAQGDVLFTLDMDYLEEAILTQTQELRKQKLSIQDAWSQSSASQKQRQNQQAQAEENYNSAVSQAETGLDRAGQELDRAEEALENYYNGLSDSQTQEAALTQAANLAKDAYDGACAALEELQREQEEAVRAALDQAEEGADPEAIAQAVRAEYAPRIAQAETDLSEARQTMEAAAAALESFRQTPGETEEELLARREAAQQAYDDACAALDNAETVYSRAIASANLPQGSNHAAQIGQITYDQMSLALEKLEALRQAGGEILAPVDGIVLSCQIQTGGKTTDTTALLLAELEQGCRFTCLVTEEQSQYIGVGDRVTLQAGSTGRRYEDLPVTTFAPGEEEGTYRLTVQLPGGTLGLGVSAQLSYTKRSQPYTCCVPLSALHLDENNRPYVLTVQEVDSVLGAQLQARKVSVTVLEQNETTAALAEGALNSQQQVIVSADRAVDTGSRVRVS